MRRLAVLALMLAVPARADFRFAIQNDTFTSVDPPFDDMGFTNDVDIAFWRPYHEYVIGGRVFDRWITEDVPSGGRRDDLVDLIGFAARTFGAPAERELTPSVRIGPTFTGNLGGRWGQNAFHTVCRCGRLLDEGLQNTYVGDNEAGLLVAGRVLGSAGLPWAQAYGYVDGQASLGAGVSAAELAGGGQLLASAGKNRFGVHVELVEQRFHVHDDRLAITGGYRPGWSSAYRIGVHFARGRVGIDYEYRANEGNSGEPIGMVAITIKQAGYAF